MKRKYIFEAELSDEESKNLKEVGKIFETTRGWNIGIKIDPEGLIPAHLQGDVKRFIGNCLVCLYDLTPRDKSRKIH